MLIDEFLSDYDFVEKHGISIDADAATIYRAANEVNFGQSFVIRWLFRFRGLSGENVTLRSLRRTRFELLGETPNRELLLGLVGKFWTPRGDLKKVDAESFKTFDRPGYAKAVWNFSLHTEGECSRLMTETRVRCLDAGSRRSFGFYWMFVRPFSGLIRMEMLRVIKQKAESI
ncbi:MAG TPA: hypothetical protein VNA22_06595 [Pyrinomonadaceae bacterium]|nr:hypothetical protein [Pyrinomonadaceae bacterium]